MAATARLKEAQSRYDALVAEENKLRSTIATADEEEREAVIAAIKAKPSASPYQAVDGEVAKIRTRKQNAEKRLPNLQTELDALRLVIAAENQLVAEAKFASVTADAEACTRIELEGWEEFGKYIAAMHETWLTKIVAPAEERDRIHLEAEASGVLGGDQPETEAKRKFLAAVSAPIQPFSVDFEEAVTRAVKVAVDSGNSGYRITESNHGVSADDQRRLPTLIPDLRATNRNAELSGKTQKVASNNRAVEGFGGGLAVAS